MPTPADSQRSPGWRSIYFNAGSIPFWTVHVAAILGVVMVGFSWSGLLLAAIMYFARMFVLTAGYHRYFAHRSFKTSRAFQFVLAVLGETCAQMGPLWWAANHRLHHKHSDTDEDLHSPSRQGFWWAHLGWHMGGTNGETRVDKIADFASYPELVWINRREVALIPAVVLALVIYAIGGFDALVWGFFVSTVLLWHGVFCINSLSHLIGRRRFETSDTSRNHWGLALLTMGEGWHNNHHHYQSSTAQGFYWWEIDMTYYGLRVLAMLGLVWDLRRPPKALLAGAGESGVPRWLARLATARRR